jgi:beta-glucanase (GH16 family)
MLLYVRRGLSGGEHMVRPREYSKTLQMPGIRTNNSFITYTFTWQPSRVTWAMNGVPIFTRKTGDKAQWQDMKKKKLS